jgi:hypothetical protein
VVAISFSNSLYIKLFIIKMMDKNKDDNVSGSKLLEIKINKKEYK